MGIWDKIRRENFEEDDIEEVEAIPAEKEKAPEAPSSFARSTGSSGVELKVVRPETYDAVGKIADHLINRKTVVLNLEATNKETAKRLIDFLSGVAYSINGTIRRVATNTFVIAPSNVGISGEAENGDTPKATPKAEANDDFSF